MDRSNTTSRYPGILTTDLVTSLTLVVLLAFPCLGAIPDPNSISKDISATDSVFMKAEKIYLDALKQSSSTDEKYSALRNLGFLYAQNGKKRQADATVDQLITQFSGNREIVQTVTNISDNFRQYGHHAEACELYQNVISRWPSDEHGMWSQMGLAISKACLGDEAAADVSIRKVKTEYPQHEQFISRAICIIADNYRKTLNNHAKASELYQYVVEKWTDVEFGLWSSMGLAISNIELHNDKLAEFGTNKILEKFAGDERQAIALCQIADAHRSQSQFEKARNLYQQTVNTWPKTEYGLWSLMGMAICDSRLNSSSDIQPSIERLNKEYADNPKLSEAVFLLSEEYYNRAMSHLGEGRESEAQQCMDQAIGQWTQLSARFPQSSINVEINYLMGDCYRKKGQVAKALSCYVNLVSNWPDHRFSSDALFKIGRCLELLQRERKIIKLQADMQIETMYRSLVAKYPNCPAAQHAKNWLSQQQNAR